ncbi:MAG: class I SAM-dependent methyltransferase, partial [Actinomycetota bacterium]|nr:class I SAM-dependent methyltransferase [Actinomycetota bacterium]
MAQLPAGQDKVRAVRNMFDRIAPRYDLVNRIMTFGMDRGWRSRAVRSLGLPPSSVVLDVACGTGDLCCEMASAGLRPVGID